VNQAADEATALNTSKLLQLIDAQFEEATPARVSGTIAADERHHQPWGLIHGGLYTAAIETFATIGAFQAVKQEGAQVVGVSNATDFLRSHRTGRLRVTGEPVHQGRSYQLWQVEIRTDDDDAKLVARGQVRLQNIDSRS
jgi:1,4-dihydroxy-2-naphthoyl-CoA hydrolase